MDICYCYHGKQVCEPGFAWGPGIKGQYKIMFIHAGKGLYQIGGQTFHLQQGQGFIVYNDILCYMEADPTDPWIYSWIAFSGTGVISLFERVHISPLQPVFRYSPLFWSDPYLDELSACDENHNTSELRRQSILFGCLADWIEMLIATSQLLPEPRPKDVYIRKAVEFIRMNYNQRISISQVARMVGIDRVYMSVLFKEILDVSPQQYLLNLRMDKAGELLNNPLLSIVEVSHSVGYSDPLLFSKMFKRVKGHSPSHFRDGLKRDRSIGLSTTPD
ncbi:AraC family transcriptional regulator [Paenibacillus tuaregi]|uniref:AraC family transcriptional regulator n=1 Tax=Paenibacillus tuaregi TaxID=1816681 RepID=UPI000838B5CC|nr:AraC family transcriptional regulator [Paenibacillus tuaregi]